MESTRQRVGDDCSAGERVMKLKFLLLLLSAANLFAAATQWYVDKDSPGPTHNGTSWNNAWTSLAGIGTTPAAGDTVNISGGTAGSTNTYTQTSTWVPKSGTIGNPITYQISSEAGHNGYAKFNMSPSATWLDASSKSYIIVSGDNGSPINTNTWTHAHIIISNEQEPISAASSTSVRVSYVNCGSTPYGIRLNDSTGYEIDHCYLDKNAASSDDFAVSSVNANGSTWDVNKFHHNKLRVIATTCGDGDDGIQGIGDGVSVYNNIFIQYIGNYTGNQHGDGIQPTSGAWLKFYNNYFQDWGNYSIFVDAYWGDVTHCWIYNNVTAITVHSLESTCDAIRGIVIVPDGGAFGNLGRWPKFTDVIVANNVAVDYGGKNGIEFDQNGGVGSSSFVGCLVQNNIVINSDISIASGITNNHNVVFTSGQATSHVVSYADNSTSNDYHIINSSETSLKDAGVDLSAYFSTDAEGNTRPQGSSWDIGPLEFLSGVAVPGTLALNSSAQTVSENVGSVQFSVSRSGGSSGTVGISYTTGNGTATAPGDYTTTSGTLTWANGDTANKTITIPIIDDSTVESTESFSLILSSPTGGSTLGSPSTATVTITDNDTLPATISVSPSTAQTFTDTDVNQSRTLTFTVSNTGGGTLSGSVSGLSAPFSIVSGSPYSIGGGGNQVVTIRFAPTAVGTFSQTAAFSGGAGASRGLTGTGLAVNSTVLSGVAVAGPVSFNP
jgi:hypothetical protein